MRVPTLLQLHLVNSTLKKGHNYVSTSPTGMGSPFDTDSEQLVVNN